MAEEKKKGLALAILDAAKPAKKPAESEPTGDEDAGALSAAEDFVSAVKGGDAAAVLAAFRDLKELA